MATYRNVQISFWTDSKVADDFTPEDKFFFLYLLTNPHTNTCGCYELSIKQMSLDTGYSKDTIEKLIARLQEVHKVIRYSKENKEVLLINWRKYNWTTSEKLRASILSAIKPIKTREFKNFLIKCYENLDCNDEYNTLFDSVDTPIDTGVDNDDMGIDETFSLVSDSLGSDNISEMPKIVKHEYGEYKHVRLSDTQYEKLVNDYGEEAVLTGIKKVDEYCQEHGKTYKDYNLTLRKWGIDAPKIKETQTTDCKQVQRILQ